LPTIVPSARSVASDGKDPQVVVTVAESWVEPPAVTDTGCGETATERMRSETVTGTAALRAGSAWLVATTW
jgi:hypothetical protein